MAGIYTPWTDKETGETVETYAVVTTEANKLMRQVHNSKMRMPSILSEDLAWEWLFGNLDDARITEIASTQLVDTEMNAYSIAKEFTTSLNPMEKFEYEDLPALEGISLSEHSGAPTITPTKPSAGTSKPEQGSLF